MLFPTCSEGFRRISIVAGVLVGSVALGGLLVLGPISIVQRQTQALATPDPSSLWKPVPPDDPASLWKPVDSDAVPDAPQTATPDEQAPWARPQAAQPGPSTKYAQPATQSDNPYAAIATKDAQNANSAPAKVTTNPSTMSEPQPPKPHIIWHYILWGIGYLLLTFATFYIGILAIRSLGWVIAGFRIKPS